MSDVESLIDSLNIDEKCQFTPPKTTYEICTSLSPENQKILLSALRHPEFYGSGHKRLSQFVALVLRHHSPPKLIDYTQPLNIKKKPVFGKVERRRIMPHTVVIRLLAILCESDEDMTTTEYDIQNLLEVLCTPYKYRTRADILCSISILTRIITFRPILVIGTIAEQIDDDKYLLHLIKELDKYADRFEFSHDESQIIMYILQILNEIAHVDYDAHMYPDGVAIVRSCYSEIDMFHKIINLTIHLTYADPNPVITKAIEYSVKLCRIMFYGYLTVEDEISDDDDIIWMAKLVFKYTKTSGGNPEIIRSLLGFLIHVLSENDTEHQKEFRYLVPDIQDLFDIYKTHEIICMSMTILHQFIKRLNITESDFVVSVVNEKVLKILAGQIVESSEQKDYVDLHVYMNMFVSYCMKVDITHPMDGIEPLVEAVVRNINTPHGQDKHVLVELLLQLAATKFHLFRIMLTLSNRDILGMFADTAHCTPYPMNLVRLYSTSELIPRIRTVTENTIPADICSICVGPFEPGNQIVTLPCHVNHTFHCYSGDTARSCPGVEMWLVQHNTCPLCTVPLKTKKDLVNDMLGKPIDSYECIYGIIALHHSAKQNSQTVFDLMTSSPDITQYLCTLRPTNSKQLLSYILLLQIMIDTPLKTHPVAFEIIQTAIYILTESFNHDQHKDTLFEKSVSTIVTSFLSNTRLAREFYDHGGESIVFNIYRQVERDNAMEPVLRLLQICTLVYKEGVWVNHKVPDDVVKKLFRHSKRALELRLNTQLMPSLNLLCVYSRINIQHMVEILESLDGLDHMLRCIKSHATSSWIIRYTVLCISMMVNTKESLMNRLFDLNGEVVVVNAVMTSYTVYQPAAHQPIVSLFERICVSPRFVLPMDRIFRYMYMSLDKLVGRAVLINTILNTTSAFINHSPDMKMKARRYGSVEWLMKMKEFPSCTSSMKLMADNLCKQILI